MLPAAISGNHSRCQDNQRQSVADKQLRSSGEKFVDKFPSAGHNLALLEFDELTLSFELEGLAGVGTVLPGSGACEFLGLVEHSLNSARVAKKSDVAQRRATSCSVEAGKKQGMQRDISRRGNSFLLEREATPKLSTTRFEP
jgi:hypothetical protein